MAMNYKQAWESLKVELQKLTQRESSKGKELEVAIGNLIGSYCLGLMDRAEVEQIVDKSISDSEKIEKPVYLISLKKDNPFEALNGIFGLKVVAGDSFGSVSRAIASKLGVPHMAVRSLVVSIKKIDTMKCTGGYKDVQKLNVDEYLVLMSNYKDVAVDVDFMRSNKRNEG